MLNACPSALKCESSHPEFVRFFFQNKISEREEELPRFRLSFGLQKKNRQTPVISGPNLLLLFKSSPPPSANLPSCYQNLICANQSCYQNRI